MRFYDTLLLTAAETFIEIGQTIWCQIHRFQMSPCAERLRNSLTLPVHTGGTGSHNPNISSTQNLGFVWKEMEVLKTLPGYESTFLHQVLAAIPSKSLYHTINVIPEKANSGRCKLPVSWGKEKGRNPDRWYPQWENSTKQIMVEHLVSFQLRQKLTTCRHLIQIKHVYLLSAPPPHKNLD